MAQTRRITLKGLENDIYSGDELCEFDDGYIGVDLDSLSAREAETVQIVREMLGRD